MSQIMKDGAKTNGFSANWNGRCREGVESAQLLVSSSKIRGGRFMHLRRLFLSLALTLVAAGAFAQQTGSISGTVTASDGSALPGVTIEARSNALPQPRVTNTDVS